MVELSLCNHVDRVLQNGVLRGQWCWSVRCRWCSYQAPRHRLTSLRRAPRMRHQRSCGQPRPATRTNARPAPAVGSEPARLRQPSFAPPPSSSSCCRPPRRRALCLAPPQHASLATRNWRRAILPGVLPLRQALPRSVLVLLVQHVGVCGPQCHCPSKLASAEPLRFTSKADGRYAPSCTNDLRGRKNFAHERTLQVKGHSEHSNERRNELWPSTLVPNDVGNVCVPIRTLTSRVLEHSTGSRRHRLLI